jgi:hypothetical protein
MKPKNPCKACPVGNGGHICDRAKNGKSLCPDYAFYALYQAQCKIRAMVRTIKAYECSRCHVHDDTACDNCHFYKFTKKGRAR